MLRFTKVPKLLQNVCWTSTNAMKEMVVLPDFHCWYQFLLIRFQFRVMHSNEYPVVLEVQRSCLIKFTTFKCWKCIGHSLKKICFSSLHTLMTSSVKKVPLNALLTCCNELILSNVCVVSTILVGLFSWYRMNFKCLLRGNRSLF